MHCFKYEAFQCDFIMGCRANKLEQRLHNDPSVSSSGAWMQPSHVQLILFTGYILGDADILSHKFLAIHEWHGSNEKQ
jgi:hypothetical protein